MAAANMDLDQQETYVHLLYAVVNEVNAMHDSLPEASQDLFKNVIMENTKLALENMERALELMENPPDILNEIYMNAWLLLNELKTIEESRNNFLRPKRSTFKLRKQFRRKSLRGGGGGSGGPNGGSNKSNDRLVPVSGASNRRLVPVSGASDPSPANIQRREDLDEARTNLILSRLLKFVITSLGLCSAVMAYQGMESLKDGLIDGTAYTAGVGQRAIGEFRAGLPKWLGGAEFINPLIIPPVVVDELRRAQLVEAKPITESGEYDVKMNAEGHVNGTFLQTHFELAVEGITHSIQEIASLPILQEDFGVRFHNLTTTLTGAIQSHQQCRTENPLKPGGLFTSASPDPCASLQETVTTLTAQKKSVDEQIRIINDRISQLSDPLQSTPFLFAEQLGTGMAYVMEQFPPTAPSSNNVVELEQINISGNGPKWLMNFDPISVGNLYRAPVSSNSAKAAMDSSVSALPGYQTTLKGLIDSEMNVSGYVQTLQQRQLPNVFKSIKSYKLALDYELGNVITEVENARQAVESANKALEKAQNEHTQAQTRASEAEDALRQATSVKEAANAELARAQASVVPVSTGSRTAQIARSWTPDILKSAVKAVLPSKAIESIRAANVAASTGNATAAVRNQAQASVIAATNNLEAVRRAKEAADKLLTAKQTALTSALTRKTEADSELSRASGKLAEAETAHSSGILEVKEALDKLEKVTDEIPKSAAGSKPNIQRPVPRENLRGSDKAIIDMLGALKGPLALGAPDRVGIFNPANLRQGKSVFKAMEQCRTQIVKAKGARRNKMLNEFELLFSHVCDFDILKKASDVYAADQETIKVREKVKGVKLVEKAQNPGITIGLQLVEAYRDEVSTQMAQEKAKFQAANPGENILGNKVYVQLKDEQWALDKLEEGLRAMDLKRIKFPMAENEIETILGKMKVDFSRFRAATRAKFRLKREQGMSLDKIEEEIAKQVPDDVISLNEFQWMIWGDKHKKGDMWSTAFMGFTSALGVLLTGIILRSLWVIYVKLPMALPLAAYGYFRRKISASNGNLMLQQDCDYTILRLNHEMSNTSDPVKRQAIIQQIRVNLAMKASIEVKPGEIKALEQLMTLTAPALANAPAAKPAALANAPAAKPAALANAPAALANAAAPSAKPAAALEHQTLPIPPDGNCFFSAIFRSASARGILDELAACLGIDARSEVAFIRTFRAKLARYIRDGNEITEGFYEQLKESVRNNLELYKQQFVALPRWLQQILEPELNVQQLGRNIYKLTDRRGVDSDPTGIVISEMDFDTFKNNLATSIEKNQSWVGEHEVEIIKKMLAGCNVTVVIFSNSKKKTDVKLNLIDVKGNPILNLFNSGELHYEYFQMPDPENLARVKARVAAAAAAVAPPSTVPASQAAAAAPQALPAPQVAAAAAASGTPISLVGTPSPGFRPTLMIPSARPAPAPASVAAAGSAAPQALPAPQVAAAAGARPPAPASRPPAAGSAAPVGIRLRIATPRSAAPQALPAPQVAAAAAASGARPPAPASRPPAAGSAARPPAPAPAPTNGLATQPASPAPRRRTRRRQNRRARRARRATRKY